MSGTIWDLPSLLITPTMESCLPEGGQRHASTEPSWSLLSLLRMEGQVGGQTVERWMHRQMEKENREIKEGQTNQRMNGELDGQMTEVWMD